VTSSCNLSSDKKPNTVACGAVLLLYASCLHVATTTVAAAKSISGL
jgi:hypothetical protein